MSFVTNFLIMNAADIRDTESDQRMFWLIAIPLTAVTLAAAFLYGYRGFQIEDWVSARLLGQDQGLSEQQWYSSRRTRKSVFNGSSTRSRFQHAEKGLTFEDMRQNDRHNSRGRRWWSLRSVRGARRESRGIERSKLLSYACQTENLC